jgi:hypothetical protein
LKRDLLGAVLNSAMIVASSAAVVSTEKTYMLLSKQLARSDRANIGADRTRDRQKRR